MLYIDIDATVRDLEGAIEGVITGDAWDEKVDGIEFCDYISLHPETLIRARATQYYTTILDAVGEKNTFHFLTKQRDDWKPFTEQWLDLHFKNYKIHYVDEIEDKMVRLKPDDILIDDYPYFSNYNQVILLDYPYNKHINCKWRVKSAEELNVLMKKLKTKWSDNEKTEKKNH